MSLDIRLLLLL